jgi:hypothetical protein
MLLRLRFLGRTTTSTRLGIPCLCLPTPLLGSYPKPLMMLAVMVLALTVTSAHVPSPPASRGHHCWRSSRMSSAKARCSPPHSHQRRRSCRQRQTRHAWRHRLGGTFAVRLVTVIRVKTALSENSASWQVHVMRSGRPQSSRPWQHHRSSPSPSQLDRLRTSIPTEGGGRRQILRGSKSAWTTSHRSSF